MRKLLLIIILSVALSNCKEEEQLPPLKPELELPSNNSTSTELDLTFSWKESSSADSYNFQISIQSDFISIEVNKTDLSAMSIDIEKLKPITTYYWRVNAENEAGISPWSSTNILTTKSLTVPTLLTPSDNSTQPINNIQFSWNPTSEASGYNLQISTKPDFLVLVNNLGNLTNATSTISGLVHSTNYYWRVSSIKNSSNSDWSAVRKFTTEPLGIPTLISPENNIKNLPKTIEFKWSSVKDASAYNLQVSTFDNFSSLVINKSNLATLTFSSANFKWNTKYYWRVNAMVANCQSEWSEIRNFTTELPTEGLIAWYPFNGNANDNSLKGNNGVINGGVTLTSDRYNKLNSAYLFDGTSGYIEVPTLNNQAYKPISYSAWVIIGSYFPLSPGIKFRSILGRQEQSNTTCGMVGFYADQNVDGGGYDNTFLYWMGATSTPDVPYSKTKPTLNSWVHVVFTQDENGNFNFYMNGILTNSGNLTNSQNSNISFRIGAGIGANSFFWNNKIDDVRIYNRVLSSEEIIALNNE